MYNNLLDCIAGPACSKFGDVSLVEVSPAAVVGDVQVGVIRLGRPQHEVNAGRDLGQVLNCR